MTLQDIPAAAWTAIVGAIGLIGGWIAKAGPNRADAAATLTNAGVALVNELQEQNELLRVEIGDLKTENRKLRSEVSDLRVQVDRLQTSIDQLRAVD
jgi:uncharacterized protein YlxW (UPF0749 family)